MKEPRKVVQAVLWQFIYWEYDARQFKDILEPKMFLDYFRLFEILASTEKEKIVKDGMLTTEIMNIFTSEKLNEITAEVITSTYYSFYLYKDIEFLIQNYYKHKNADDVFAQVDAVRRANEQLQRMQSDNEAKKYQIGSLYDKIVQDSIKLSKKEGILGHATGIDSLDRLTEWLQQGTLMRLTAYSNIGKSKLAYHICNQILKQDLYVIFFSLEVTKERVVHNLMMNWYNKDYNFISRGKWIEDYWIDCADFFGKKLEVVDDIYSLNRIIWYTKARKPDVIFIDFVQNIQTDKKDEYQAMTEVAVQLQQLAISEKIAIFDLSQVSQEQAGNFRVGGKIPSKGSGALVASADVNLVMERDQDTWHNLLYVAKNKFWMNGKCIELDMDFSKNQVTDLGEHILQSKTYTKM